MIQVFMDKRGSGKSKEMISKANLKVKDSKGHIVFIDDDSRPMHELERAIRFINTESFEIDSFSSLYGLICGIISENFDTDTIYIDGLLNKIDFENECSTKDYEKIEKLAEENKISLVFAVNDDNSIPDFVKKYVTNKLD